MLIYSVIGVILFAITILSVRSVRDLDSEDVFIALLVFGVFWPVGAVQIFFMVFIDVINNTRK